MLYFFMVCCLSSSEEWFRIITIYKSCFFCSHPLPLTAKRIDTSPLWTFCSYLPSLLHYSLWIIFVFVIVFDTLAYSLVNDLKSGDHRLDSISGHYQSPDMNTHTRNFFAFLAQKDLFFRNIWIHKLADPFFAFAAQKRLLLCKCLYFALSRISLLDNCVFSSSIFSLGSSLYMLRDSIYSFWMASLCANKPSDMSTFHKFPFNYL